MYSQFWYRKLPAIALISTLAACLLPIGSVLACPVLNDGSNTLGIWDDFQVSSSGTVTISITGAPAPNTISDYSFDLSSLAGVNEWSTQKFIGSLVGEGSLSIPATPGLIYDVSLNNLFGANTSGSPSVELTFRPDTPVPLPGSVMLLLSGVVLAFVGHQGRKAALV